MFGDGKSGGAAMPSTIIRILDFGGTWCVKLDCGCSRKGLTSDDLKREQLVIGKRVKCEKHDREAGENL
jgi:hypothetical protein